MDIDGDDDCKGRGGGVQDGEDDGGRERKEGDRYLYMLLPGRNPMPEMGGAEGHRSVFALRLAHFFHPLSWATIFSP